MYETVNILFILRKVSMDKIVLVKKVAAGVFYAISALLILLLSVIILKRNTMLHVSGLLIMAIAICIPVIIATILLLSIVQEEEKRYMVMKGSISAVFVFYCLILVAILFLIGHRGDNGAGTVSIKEYLKWNMNLIPFKTIIGYTRFFINGSINESIIIENLLGNVLLFFPMGILLPCIFENLRRFNRFAVAMLISLVSVEILQLLTRSGICDIDDIILNFIGAVSAFGIWRLTVIQKLLSKIYVLNR